MERQEKEEGEEKVDARNDEKGIHQQRADAQCW
jgi:hypothetical protein